MFIFVIKVSRPMASTNTPVQRPWYILGEYVSMVTCFNVKVKSKSYISTHCVPSTLNKSWDHIKMKNYLVKNYIELHITFILCKGFMQRARQRNIFFLSPLRIPSCWVLLLKKQPVDKNMVKDILNLQEKKQRL